MMVSRKILLFIVCRQLNLAQGVGYYHFIDYSSVNSAFGIYLSFSWFCRRPKSVLCSTQQMMMTTWTHPGRMPRTLMRMMRIPIKSKFQVKNKMNAKAIMYDSTV